MVEFRTPNSCCPCRTPGVFSVRTNCLLKDLLVLIINHEKKEQGPVKKLVPNKK